MRASALEYRFRFAIHGILFGLAFACPWAEPLGWTTKSAWLVLSTVIARQGWLPFTSASMAILLYVLLFTGLGAWLRVWGSAYLGAGVVQSGAMHGSTQVRGMLADGPYRHTRNPLYLGTLLHTMGLVMLIPPSGAVFLVATIWILQFRLALAEEPFLTAQFGEAYREYAARVPRFLPMIAAQVPAAGAKPHWLLALAGEIYFSGVFVTLAIFGWGFNPMPIRQGVLISLGLWLVMIALIPRAKKDDVEQAEARSTG
jgi:protein-S-isoprenylcysteine O-methyltransferase Ste14